ncbi:MAG: sensor histidine kinase [Jejuia sp.]
MVQTGERVLSSASERYMLAYMIIVLAVITSLVILFFIVFQKRKNKLLIDRIKQQQAFEEEIIKAQTEAQEQTLKNIGWELHDNVGQMLSFASMQLSLLKMQVSSDVQDKFKDTTEALRNGLKEVRALSKTLNNDVILNIGFEKSIANELDRLKRMEFASAELKKVGKKVSFTNRKHEIILFRILQEFLSNSVKYSEANNLKITLDYKPEHISITAEDDGKGFNMEKIEQGSGLINMKSRAELIGANLKLTSKPNEGVKLEVVYPINADQSA